MSKVRCDGEKKEEKKLYEIMNALEIVDDERNMGETKRGDQANIGDYGDVVFYGIRGYRNRRDYCFFTQSINKTENSIFIQTSCFYI